MEIETSSQEVSWGCRESGYIKSSGVSDHCGNVARNFAGRGANSISPFLDSSLFVTTLLLEITRLSNRSTVKRRMMAPFLRQKRRGWETQIINCDSWYNHLWVLLMNVKQNLCLITNPLFLFTLKNNNNIQIKKQIIKL